LISGCMIVFLMNGVHFNCVEYTIGIGTMQ
jgi:hypothetical protein